jgi:hypothetical protein
LSVAWCVTFPEREINGWPEAIQAAAAWLVQHRDQNVVLYDMLLDHTPGRRAVVLYVVDDDDLLGEHSPEAPPP